jgi:hypothetical protein
MIRAGFESWNLGAVLYIAINVAACIFTLTIGVSDPLLIG